MTPQHPSNQQLYWQVKNLLYSWHQETDNHLLKTLAMMVTGLFLGRHVQLWEIALWVPLPIQLTSLVRRFERFVADPRVKVAAFFHPFVLAGISCLGNETAYLILDCTQAGQKCRTLVVGLARLNLRDEGFLDVEHTEVNLSGSGIRFVSREPFDVGTLIELKLRLPLGDGVVCYGNVVRSLERKDGTYEVALNFSEMDDEVREKIIYHVLDRQRRLVSSAHRNGTKPQGETSDHHNLQ